MDLDDYTGQQNKGKPFKMPNLRPTKNNRNVGKKRYRYYLINRYNLQIYVRIRTIFNLHIRDHFSTSSHHTYLTVSKLTND